MSRVPKPQEIYRHFKGNLYQIITVAEHSETGERLVIYQALYGDFKIYARELGMFTGRVDREKYPNASQEYRFMLVETHDMPEKEAAKETVKETVKETEKETGVEKGKETTNEAVKETGKEAVSEKTSEVTKAETESDEPELDPMLLEFLDANTYEAKLNILAGVHHRITQDMITTMAVSCDIEVGDGDMEDRYRQLKTCLLTMEKYECNRMG